MRKPISRQLFPPPQSGRRIPPIAATKTDTGEDRPNARDLLGTVNSASEGAAATWLAFLGTMAYLAVTLGGVTHVDLLLNNDTTLPFVSVKVPLVTFFVMAPLAFVLVHFSLLLQHVVLSRKLAAFEERLAKEEPSRDRGTQNIRDELHSYTFTQVASGKPKGAVVDMAQRLVISLTLVVFPMLLLTFFQIGFLAYHSEPITWWHRGMLALDVGVVWCLARHLVRVDPTSKIRLTDWWHATSRTKWRFIVGWRRAVDRTRSALVSRTSPGANLLRPLLIGARRSGTFAIRVVAPTLVVIVALMLFSFCVATLPDSPDTWIRLDKWMASIPLLSEPVPYCRPTPQRTAYGSEEFTRCPEVTSATRRALYPTAVLFERQVNETIGRSDSLLGWSRNLIVTDKDLVKDDKTESRLNLRGRDLRYATLDRANLRRADLHGAKLGGARLVATNLNSANFRIASLHGADLTWAELQGASLLRARLQGAYLIWAGLQGADLSGARLQGASLFRARLLGADLTWAELQGADLTGASLQGADLSGARLQGADLFWAELQGANLTGSRLHGTNLTGAELQGANLTRVELLGADLTEAKLQGADLSGARIWRVSTPDSRGVPVGRDGRYLVSFAQMDIRTVNDDERKVFREAIANLEMLHVTMKKDGAPSHQRVEDASKKVVARINPLLETADNDKWSIRDELRAWCELERQPPPDPVELSTYLARLACTDNTDKGYLAQRLIDRVLERAPNIFLEGIKGCPVLPRISADIKARLERAAQQDRDKVAKRKREKPENVEQRTPPNAPEVCASLVDRPPNPQPPNPPSSTPR
jgi:uncharacterized protein YjbI with pentapeptide repeats